MEHDSRVTGLVIGCAIEVHKALGPALKETAYQSAMCAALSRQNIPYTAQKKIGVSFNGIKVGDYQPDLIVDNTVVVEIKSVDRLAPVFISQVISYLRVTDLHVGLILNFKTVKMVHGIKRVVL